MQIMVGPQFLTQRSHQVVCGIRLILRQAFSQTLKTGGPEGMHVFITNYIKLYCRQNY